MERERRRSSFRPQPIRVPLRLVDHLVALLLLHARHFILPNVELPQLALELAEALQTLRRQRATHGRGLDGAAGLPLMLAVAEAALLPQLFDLREGRLDPLVPFPELDLAQARRIDEQAAAGGQEQLAVRGGVPAAVVPLAHLARALGVAAEKTVDERRLADARGAEEAHGPARHEVGRELLAILSSQGAHAVDGYPQGDRLLLQQAGLGVRAAVELVEDDHGLGTAVPGGGEIALDAAGIEVAVEAGDEEDRVHVGGHALLLGALAGALAGELGIARQDGVDHRPPLALGRPQAATVPPRRMPRALRPFELMPQLAGEVRVILGVAGRDLIEAPLRGHAGGDEPLLRVRREGRREEVVPAEVGESQKITRPCRRPPAAIAGPPRRSPTNQRSGCGG